MHFSIRLSAATAALVLLLTLAWASSAAAAYPPSRTLSTETRSAGAPQIVAHGGGEATVIWNTSFFGVDGTRIAADGSNGPILRLSSPEADSVFDTQLVGSESGVATVLSVAEFTNPSGEGQRRTLEAGRVSPSGAPSVQTVVDDDGKPDFGSVAIAPSGVSTVVWGTYHRARPRVMTKQIAAAGGQGRPRKIGAGNLPAVGADADGRATAAWSAGARVARISSGGRPRGVRRIAPVDDPGFLGGVVSDEARRPIVLRRFERGEGGSPGLLAGLVLRADGTRKRRIVLTRGHDIDGDVAWDVDDRGRVAIAWSETSGGGRHRVRLARISRKGRLDEVATITRAREDAVSPDVGLGAGGRATVVWAEAEAERVEVATVSRGDERPRPTVVSRTGLRSESPAVAIDSRGRALLVWRSKGPPDGFSVQFTRSLDG